MLIKEQEIFLCNKKKTGNSLHFIIYMHLYALTMLYLGQSSPREKVPEEKRLGLAGK